jgi:hypothetical protein
VSKERQIDLQKVMDALLCRFYHNNRKTYDEVSKKVNLSKGIPKSKMTRNLKVYVGKKFIHVSEKEIHRAIEELKKRKMILEITDGHRNILITIRYDDVLAAKDRHEKGLKEFFKKHWESSALDPIRDIGFDI